MAWYDVFRMTKAAPERSSRDQPASPVAGWSGQRNAITYSEAVDAEVALKHPIVYRCLTKIASSVASVKFYAEQDPNVTTNARANKGLVKAMNDLLESPNDYFTQNQLLYWMALNFACYGRIPFKVGVSPIQPDYKPTGIYPLTTRFFQTTRDDRGLVVGYGYSTVTNGPTKETWPTRAKAAPGKNYAYEIVRPNLDGTFESKNNVHPLGAVGLPAQVITLLMKRAADTASGHPNVKYIISAEKTLTKQQKKEIVDHIEGSAVDGEWSGGILFLYNTAIKVDKLDNDLSNIHSKVPLDDMSRQIVGAFGIPIALIGLGAADAAKFAGNYTESRRSFWEDTLIPEYLSPIATGLTAALCPSGMRIVPDLDSIEAISEARVAKAEKLGKVDYLTVREKRVATGYSPEPDPEDKSGYSAPAKTPTTPNNQPQDQTQ